MNHKHAKEFASDAIRYWWHGNRDDDNVFAHDNLYRAHGYSHKDAETIHYETGCICFAYEFEPGLMLFNALLAYFRCRADAAALGCPE